MKSLFQYKMIIKVVLSLTIALIVFLTFQAIYETDNWEPFNIDFDSRNHIILAYGSLLGGILAFLSILFVLYQVYEQSQQILTEKEEAKNENKQDLRDRLLLLINYLKVLEKDIIEQGERMKDFIDSESENPSKMNTMYFNTNKNFERVIEMDILSNFKAFQLFFEEDEKDWQKQFINLYEISDFYNEVFKEMKKKYNSHIDDKVKKLKSISLDMRNLLDSNSRLVDRYMEEYGKDEYLHFSWSNLMNKYTHAHYTYLDEVKKEGEYPEFRHISENLLLVLIEQAMILRKDEGYDNKGSRNIIESASTIRKDIWEVEEYSRQYAEDLKKLFENYFCSDNKSLNELKSIKLETKNKITN